MAAHTYICRMSGFRPYNATYSITQSIRNIRNCKIRKYTAITGKSCTPAFSGIIKTRREHSHVGGDGSKPSS